MLSVRSARRDDLDAVIELAQLAGPGFTSLAVPPEELAARLELSEESFQKEVTAPESEVYMLVLEDSTTRRVLGISAIKAVVGIKKPYYNFRLVNLSHTSSSVKRRLDQDVMFLVTDFAGASEVGTLFVRPENRSGGTGRLIAQARYMVVAAAPHRFGDTVVSELRGCVDHEGHSPFWEHLGRRFFDMDFGEADTLSASGNNQFIADLAPKYPLYVELFPKEARDVIGVTHPDGVGARKLLEWEGFRYNRVVDIFDAGPLVSCRRDLIRTHRESRRVTFRARDNLTSTVSGIISSDRMNNLRMTYGDLEDQGEDIYLKPEILDLLHMKTGDAGRVWIRS